MIEIKTDLSIDDAVKKLSKHVETSMYVKNKECLAGKVNPNKVILYRVVPFQANSLFPIFRGTFKTIDGQTSLIGKWSYPVSAIIFTVMMIGIIGYNITADIWLKSTVSLTTLLMIFVAISLGWLSIIIGKILSVDDKEWIIKYVKYALNS